MTASDELLRAVREARRFDHVEAGGQDYLMVNVSGIPGAERLPRVLTVLLENVVRRAPTDEAAAELAARVISAGTAGEAGDEIDYMPARVLFQDFTGVPVFVDFAAMRDAMVKRGGDPAKVSPKIPCTLVVDHSVIADCAGKAGAADFNEKAEARRNRERFAFLKWAQNSFDNVTIVPPGQGICHQLNMEVISKVVATDALAHEDEPVACFDTVVGTDSHTTTVNGIGVMAWGVGGIEAEAAALGQPISMLVPAVVELRLTGRLRDGASGMDLALTVAQLLRKAGVVGTLVEVTGPGVETLTATQRACVANMTPEYGATTTLFPVDERTIEYLELTGRSADQVELVRSYMEKQGVFGAAGGRTYARTVELDLSQVETSLAGPSRPHDRVTPAGLRERFEGACAEHGHDLSETFDVDGHELRHGTIAIAAITSCTTATDPAMMAAAGILARKARSRGLATKPWVKKILAPGSHATQLLLERSGLADDLRGLGFFCCGFGCMSCIGNSGPIAASLHERASEMELASVLSGNRNFEGRISPDVSQNYLMQPQLVVAYAIAGTVDIDLSTDPLGTDQDGNAVMLADVMATDAEIKEVLDHTLSPALYEEGGKGRMAGSAAWQAIDAGSSETFAWDADSTYVRQAPYFDLAKKQDVVSVTGARALVRLGDFVTTDHISPAGSIAPDSPAAAYLRAHGVAEGDFNTYGSRRGNHEVMMRGTFANVKLQNQLAEGRRGCWTRDFLTGEVTSIFDAAEDYRAHGVPLVVVAGKLYGSGSSRDWAAKGPALLGVRAVIAESFERIHRSNLVQMGILPLEFEDGQGAESLGLDGSETYDVEPVDLSAGLPSKRDVEVVARKADGTEIRFACTVRVDTPMEGRFVSAGGILPYVLDELA